MDKVRDRLKLYFPAPSRIDNAIAAGLSELRHITRIRNVIAHTSVPARRNFRNLVQGLLGGQPAINRAAGLLSIAYPNGGGQTFFDRYADVLEATANGITG